MLDKPATPASTLCLARHIARDAGVRYVFTGNTHDEEGQSTYCHLCNARLIGRDWYDLTDWNLTALHCLRNPVRGRVRRPARNMGTTTTPHKSAGARRRGMSA